VWQRWFLDVSDEAEKLAESSVAGPVQQTGSALMNVQHTRTAGAESRERHSYARVPRHWLLLARGLWITLVILTLAIFFASLSVFMSQLHTPCTGTECANGMLLTPEQAGALTGMGLSMGDYAAFTVALTLATLVVCLVVSTLIIWRRPDDRMAFLVALMLVTLGPIIATTSMSAIPSPWRLPNACLYFLALALVMLVFSLFPTGQFVPSFTRWTLVVCLAGQVPFIFFPHAPFTLSIHADSLGWLLLLGELAILVVVQLYRYRRLSSAMQRQQIKWVVFGLAVIGTITVVGYGQLLIFPALDDSSSPSGSIYQLALNDITLCLLLLIPLSIGFAVLRYRLWDVDVLINRTLVYGALTVSLALVYVGLVIGLQALLRGLVRQDNSVAIVISTLAIYALIGPLRSRIQRLIDRRFYRRKYDAAKTLAAFSATLRHEVDLDQLREHLLAVVQETMQPTHVSLWVRPTEPARKHQATWSSPPPAP
jgi:hypothetical protein